MASVVLNGDSSGSITLSAPTAAGSTTQTLVANSGTLAPIVSGTAQASTSGTSIDFTGIPSWVKRITVMFSGVSTNSTSPLQIQIGAGSVATSGYNSGCGYGTSAGQYGNSSSAFLLEPTANATAANTMHGAFVLTNMGNNIWAGQGTFYLSQGPISCTSGGAAILSGTLDRVRITTVNGTDTFDAGSINILYE